MAEIKHIFVICGEASGDLYAGNLISALKDFSPGLKVSGIGGIMMRRAGATTYCDIKDLSVIGLFDVLRKLPKFLALKKLVLKEIEKEKPDAIIFVDFSGFNLRLAKALNKAIPAIYYVSPQVWASRKGRIKTIKKYIHKMIVLFKFEEELYKRNGIDAQCLGHPLLDTVKPSMTRTDFFHTFKLNESKTTIALLAGSRNTEIRNILPLMLSAAKIIAKEISDAQFVIAKPAHIDWEVYKKIIDAPGIDLHIVEGRAYDILNNADFSLIASGTATLEAAILRKPFLVIYKTSLWNYFFYRPQVKVAYISIVNILAQRKIVPEFIQFEARPGRIAREAINIMRDCARIELMQFGFGQVCSLLGEKGASRRAGKLITEFLKPG